MRVSTSLIARCPAILQGSQHYSAFPLGKDPENGTAEVVWIGRIMGQKNRIVISNQSEPVALAGGARMSFESQAAAKGTDLNLAALGERDRDGVRLDGWILRTRDEAGKLTGVKASSPELDVIGRTPGAVELLKKAGR